MTGLLVSFLFAVVGLALTRFVGPMQPWLAGAGATGVVLFLAALLHVPLLPVAIVLLVVSLLECGSVAAALKAAALPPHSKPDLLLALTAALLFLLAAILPLNDYDGRAFWLMKAKAIAAEDRVDGPFFRGETSTNWRNEYPPLLPLDAAILMRAGRELDERHARGLYVLFALAFALEIRRRLGSWYALVFLWLPQIAVVRDGGALSAYNDLAVAAFAGCALFELVEGESPLRFGLWLSFLALTKNEGLPFALFLLAAGAFVFRRRVVAALAPLVPAVAMLFVWRSRIERFDEEDFLSLLPRLPERLGRLDDALAAFTPHFFALEDWGLLWFAAIAAALVLVWKRRWRELGLAAAATLPMLALVFVVYMISKWDAADYVSSSASRVITQFVAPALYVISAAFGRNR